MCFEDKSNKCNILVAILAYGLASSVANKANGCVLTASKLDKNEIFWVCVTVVLLYFISYPTENGLIVTIGKTNCFLKCSRRFEPAG